MSDTVQLLLGLVLLVIGGETLVRGSVALAERVGLSPLFIGIALVGFGTSVPELVTSVQASIAGSPGIAIGSFVGSNISNILFILGTSALLIPLTVNLSGIARDGATVLAVAIIFATTSALVPLNGVVGTAYLALLAAYLVSAYMYESARTQPDHAAPVDVAQSVPKLENEPSILSKRHAQYTKRFGWLVPFLMTAAGIATIVLGGKFLVDGAIGLARTMNVSETVIGLTVVAIGTSMPEMATAIIAALRRQTDIAVGNILGSNIYNTLGIGGVVGIVAPTNVPAQIIAYDNLVGIAATVALIALAVICKGTIPRIVGALLLTGYGLYIWSIWPV